MMVSPSQSPIRRRSVASLVFRQVHELFVFLLLRSITVLYAVASSVSKSFYVQTVLTGAQSSFPVAL